MRVQARASRTKLSRSNPASTNSLSQLREIGSDRPFDWWVYPKLSRFHCMPPTSMPGRKLPKISGM